MVCQFRHTFIFTWSHFVPRCVFKLLLDFKLTSADFKQVNVGWVGSRNMIKKTLMRRRKVLKTTIIFQNIKWLQTVVLEQKFALQHASLRTGWNTIGSKARNISQKTDNIKNPEKYSKEVFFVWVILRLTFHPQGYGLLLQTLLLFFWIIHTSFSKIDGMISSLVQGKF